MEDDKKPTDTLLGCLAILATPALQAWTTGLSAWVAHVIWGWYPPFGAKVPSVPELVVMITLVLLVRPRAGNRNPDDSIWKQAFVHTLVPLFLLAAVAIVRWWFT